MGILLKNGDVYLSPDIVKKDILIEGKTIVKIDHDIPVDGHEMIDVEGKLITPGFVDLHIHLREPGGEHKETIETGTQAAARGGFTTVAAMPNTNPVPDNIETVEWLKHRIKETASVRVLSYGAITKGLKGQALTNIQELHDAGIFAFTDDGVGIQEASQMYEAMKQAAEVGTSIVAHCEDNSLIYGGSVHDGRFAREHGLKGIPNICESVQIARDVLLAEAAGAHYHVCHVSTAESVRVIRDAKRAGIHVTAEVTPHHLLLCEDDIPEVDTNYKMNPPLRSKKDQQALIEGLIDGTIDFIATDHAPHHADEKAKPMSDAPFGIVGLETAFPLLYTNLVKKGVLSLEDLLERLTTKPCEAFNLPYGRLNEGELADLTVIDLRANETINKDHFLSKGKNTPFNNWDCEGYPEMTLFEGKIVWDKRSVHA